MTSLTRFALDNARLTILGIVALIGAGILTYVDFPAQEDPDMVVRTAVVTTAFPGMAPERIEQLITRPLEEVARELPQVKHIESTSSTGLSVIHVKLQDRYYDLAPIWQDLRTKIESARGDLPDGTSGPFVNDDFGRVAVATVALTAEGFTPAEMRERARSVRRQLYDVPGLEKVELYGVQEERVFIEVSNTRLAQLGLSPAVVIDALRKQNIILPGGSITAGDVRLVVETSGNFESVDEIGDLMVELPAQTAGAPARLMALRDILTVRRGMQDPPGKPALFNGEPAVILAVSMRQGYNIAAFGRDLSHRVAQLEQQLPIGFQLRYATYQPEMVHAAISTATGNVYQTLAIVLVVVVVFLGLRTGLIVGTIVPMSMLLAIVAMGVLDIPLDRVSTASMIIALGLLVDNGIVVAEDIRRRMGAGVERRAACMDAGRELAVPLLTSTVTTIIAFLPLMLASDASGEYTRSLGKVITITLTGSWLLSMVVTPVLCFFFLRQPKDAAPRTAQAGPGRLYGAYRSVLVRILRLRWLFIAAMAALFVASLWSFQFVKKEFFAKSDRNQFLVYLELPAGTPIENTRESAQAVSRWLSDGRANPEVTGTVAYVGDGGPRFVLSLSPMEGAPNKAFLLVNTTDAAAVPAMLTKVRRHLNDHHPELRGQAKAMWMGPSETGIVRIRIVGEDPAGLERLSERIETAFHAIPGTLDVSDDWGNKVVKVRVDVDQAMARRAGVTSEDIAVSLNSFLTGLNASKYREGDTSIPIVMRADEAARGELANLANVTVFSSTTGRPVPLSQIVRFVPSFQYNAIKRYDLERALTVSGKHELLKAGELYARLKPALDALDVPPTVRLELSGELESAGDAQAALAVHLPLTGIAMLLVLVWQFNSFRRPLIIVLAIPLALIGAIAGLLATNAVFGFMAILGVLSLAGIIINNSIVLIDKFDTNRAAGMALHEAVIDGCVQRLRPICMTTLTTVLGLMPMIFFGGALWHGMGVVIAGGLAVGTLLTLGFVPAIYVTLFEPLFGRERPAGAPELPPAMSLEGRGA